MATGQKDVLKAIVGLSPYIVQNTVKDIPLLVAQNGEYLDVFEIGLWAGAQPAGGTIAIDFEHCDVAETLTDWTGTASAHNPETIDTLTYVPIHTNKRRLAPGEAVNAEITTSDDAVTNVGTLFALVSYRVAERSGDV